MLSSIVFTVPLLVASAVASPWGGPWGNWGGQGGPGGQGGKGGPNCLNDADVKTLLDGYTYLLEYPQGADFNATANKILSDSFFVSSDSINSLAGIPVSEKLKLEYPRLR